MRRCSPGRSRAGRRSSRSSLKDAELPAFLASRVWIALWGVDGPLYEQRVRELAAALKGRADRAAAADG
jgi:hypothetical protein